MRLLVLLSERASALTFYPPGANFVPNPDTTHRWDSQYTDYDVANSGNTTNVVEVVAKACKKYGIGLGLYYSLWDRKVNGEVEDQSQDAAYNEYIMKQLEELIDMTKKGSNISAISTAVLFPLPCSKDSHV